MGCRNPLVRKPGGVAVVVYATASIICFLTVRDVVAAHVDLLKVSIASVSSISLGEKQHAARDATLNDDEESKDTGSFSASAAHSVGFSCHPGGVEVY